MLLQKTRYALKALLLLTENESYKNGPMLISDLAKKGNIPQKFLESILLDLKNKGFLQSKKGKGGGYYLGKNAEEIYIGSIIRVLEGPLALLPCVSQTAYKKCEECDDEKSCGLRVLFKEVRDATAKILDNTSLAKVQNVENSMKTQKQEMYFI